MNGMRMTQNGFQWRVFVSTVMEFHVNKGGMVTELGVGRPNNRGSIPGKVN